MVRDNQILKSLTGLLQSLLIFLILQGCSGGTAPTEEEIVGTWASTEAILEFKTDGTFIGKKLPVELLKAPDANGGTFDGKGKWMIKQARKAWDQLPWYIDLQIENAPSEYVSATFLILSGSNFLENKSPWNYMFFWAGEEGGKRYKFEKK